MEVCVSVSRSGHNPQGKQPRCPLDRRLGGPQIKSGRGGEEKKIFPSIPQSCHYTDWATPAKVGSVGLF
jgi:hypothetical protein